MLKNVRVLFVVLMVLVVQVYPVEAVVIDPPEGSGSRAPRKTHVEGEVLVKFKEGVTEGQRGQYHREADAEPLSEIRALGVHRVRSKKGETTEALIERYKKNPFVEYAEPNALIEIQQAVNLPNDPYISLDTTLPDANKLWGMYNTGQSSGLSDADIDAPEAWSIQTGTGVVVVVTDSGVDDTHADLTPNMWTNTGETAGNGIDDDGNGYVDDVKGWNFVEGNNNPMDLHGHGTHVAGTIAAVGNNATGVVGVAWKGKIMPLRILYVDPVTGYPLGTADGAANAISYAANNGAKVINASWKLSAASATVQAAIGLANTKGVLFVVAAGNDAGNNDTTPVYPCSYTDINIVCVAATTRTDTLATFSNFGATSVDIGAPGVDIWSTALKVGAPCCSDISGYKRLQGTSMAAPHVSGAAVVLFSHNPTVTLANLKTALLTGDSIPGLSGKSITGMRLNLYRALTSTLILPADTTVPSTPIGLTATAISSTQINLAWTAATDNVGVTGYEIDRCSGASCTVFSLIATVSGTSYSNTGLLPTTSYSYRIRAIDAKLNKSANSSTASATTLTDTTAPTLCANDVGTLPLG
jgi:subtilisin family serine protease